MVFKKNITGWKAFILLIPWVLALFPVPLAFPIMLWGMAFGEYPEPWQMPALYTLWLVVSAIIVYKTEKNGYWVG